VRVEKASEQKEERIRILEELLDGYRALGDGPREKTSQADILLELGMLRHDLGDYARARDLLQQTLEIAEAIGDKIGVAAILGQLGTVAEAEGRQEEGVTLWAQTAATLEELASLDLQLALDSLDEAREELGEERCHEIFEDAGLP
jgi:uncharacterized protein HemY